MGVFMSRIFNLRWNGQEAIVSAMIPQGEGLAKRTFRANGAEELWAGLKALAAIQELPRRAQEVYFSKVAEREELEALTLAWLARGGEIKVLPMAGNKKAELSKKEQDDILSILSMLGDENQTAPMELSA